MKRRPELLKLSREHHTALSLCLRIARAADPAAIATLLTRVPEIFTDELEAHFRDEESGLLPQLQAAGEAQLVRRTLAEHDELRRLVAAIAAGDVGALKAFGLLLKAHVRFEEGELFAVAESRLAEALAPLPAVRQPQPAAPAATGVMR